MTYPSIDLLIQSLIAEREDVTPGGCVQIDTCTKWKLIGDTLWQIRETRFLRTLISKRIVCSVIAKVPGGYAAEAVAVNDDLWRCDCPLEFILAVAGKFNDMRWRDRVWAWHEGQLAATFGGE